MTQQTKEKMLKLEWETTKDSYYNVEVLPIPQNIIQLSAKTSEIVHFTLYKLLSKNDNA